MKTAILIAAILAQFVFIAAQQNAIAKLKHDFEAKAKDEQYHKDLLAQIRRVSKEITHDQAEGLDYCKEVIFAISQKYCKQCDEVTCIIYGEPTVLRYHTNGFAGHLEWVTHPTNSIGFGVFNEMPNAIGYSYQSRSYINGVAVP